MSSSTTLTSSRLLWFGARKSAASSNSCAPQGRRSTGTFVGQGQVAEQTGANDPDQVATQHRLDTDTGVDGHRVDLVGPLVPLGHARPGRSARRGRRSPGRRWPRPRRSPGPRLSPSWPTRIRKTTSYCAPIRAWRDGAAGLPPDELAEVVGGAPDAFEQVGDPAAEVGAARHQHHLELRPVELPRDLVQQVRQLQRLGNEFVAGDVLVGPRGDEEAGPDRLAPDEQDVVAVAVREPLAFGPRLAVFLPELAGLVVAADVEHEDHDRADGDDAERDQREEVQDVHAVPLMRQTPTRRRRSRRTRLVSYGRMSRWPACPGRRRACDASAGAPAATR